MQKTVDYKKEKLRSELVECLSGNHSFIFIKNRFVNHPYISKPNEKTTFNGMMNNLYDIKLKEFNELISEENYIDAVDVIERPWRIEWTFENKELIVEKKGIKYYYELLGDVYNDTENAREFKDEIVELFQFGKSPRLMMNDDELSDFEKLPERIKVWRGVGVNNAIEEDLIGSSWTIDYDKALFFANRNTRFKDESYPLIFGIEIEKTDVLSFITRRKESEIILDHTKLNIHQLERIYI